MAIPEALRFTVLRRLQTLDRTERGILMRASAVGLDFSLRVVLAISACSEATVRAALERACGLQIVVASGRERYAFRHALTKDIIYDEFFSEPVRALHRRIARALEAALPRGEAAVEELAYHAWAAGDVRRALRYNELAGDDAAAVHALLDARTFYARAQSLSERGSLAYNRLTEKLRLIGGSSAE